MLFILFRLAENKQVDFLLIKKKKKHTHTHKHKKNIQGKAMILVHRRLFIFYCWAQRTPGWSSSSS
jgi:hypothetical protein